MAASNDAALRAMAMKQYAAEEQALNDEEESDIKCEPRKQSASNSDQEPSVASRPTDAPSKPAQPLRRAASFERKTRSGRIALAVVGENKPEEPAKSGRPEGDNKPADSEGDDKPADSGQSQHMRLRRSISFDRARRNLSAGFTKNQGSSDNATGAAESDKGAAEKPTESNKAPSGQSGGRLVRSLSFGRSRSSSSSASSVTCNGAAAEPSHVARPPLAQEEAEEASAGAGGSDTPAPAAAAEPEAEAEAEKEGQSESGVSLP